jgi:hypothetical protein
VVKKASNGREDADRRKKRAYRETLMRAMAATSWRCWR